MQHRWWSSMPHVIRDSFAATSRFVAITIVAVCTSKVLEVAAPQIHSRFLVCVLIFLEYATTVIDAVYVLAESIMSVVKKLRSAMR